MSQLKEENIDIGEKIGNAEKYVSDNKRSLTIIGGSIIAVIAIYFGYRQFIVAPQEENAQKEMHRIPLAPDLPKRDARSGEKRWSRQNDRHARFHATRQHIVWSRFRDASQS